MKDLNFTSSPDFVNGTLLQFLCVLMADFVSWAEEKASDVGKLVGVHSRFLVVPRLRTSEYDSSRKLGYLIWGPYNKDPTNWGTILGSPIFGNPHMDFSITVTSPEQTEEGAFGLRKVHELHAGGLLLWGGMRYTSKHAL